MAVERQLALDAARKLVQSGMKTTGTVTHMKCCAQIRFGKSNRTYITYSFQAGERQFSGTDREIPPEKWTQLHVGMEIPVRFDQTRPRRHVTLMELDELEGWGYRIGFSIHSLGALAWCALRLSSIVFPGHRRRTI